MSSIFLGFGFSPGCPRVCSAKRTRFFSLWLTARTTNCPSTLKKGASQSKSLLNDRVRSLFGRSLEPLLSSGRQLPPLLLLPAPRRFLPFYHQPFSPLAPPCFFNRAHSPCVLDSLHAGVIGGLCRRAALPVRTLPRRPTCPHLAARRSFPPARRFPIKQIAALAALYLQPRHEQILAHALYPEAYFTSRF